MIQEEEPRELEEDVSGIAAKATIKDSVFTHLFRIKKYALALYRALHPKGKPISEDQLEIVTLENILLNQPYNDLGFLVGNVLLVLVEAQSTWSVNILVRVLIYAAMSIQEYIIKTKQNVYSNKKLTIPEMEFYVIYTGERKERPKELVFSKVFGEGKKTPLEIRIKMIYDGKKGDIINQYVTFTKIYQKQYKRYGRTQQAVQETIRICQDRNILKEYLEEQKKEVIDIMMTLFDKQTVLEAYLEEARNEARNEGRKEGWDKGLEKGWNEGRNEGREEALRETVKRLSRTNLSVEEIAQAVGVDLDVVTQWIHEEPAKQGKSICQVCP